MRYLIFLIFLMSSCSHEDGKNPAEKGFKQYIAILDPNGSVVSAPRSKMQGAVALFEYESPDTTYSYTYKICSTCNSPAENAKKLALHEYGHKLHHDLIFKLAGGSSSEYVVRRMEGRSRAEARTILYEDYKMEVTEKELDLYDAIYKHLKDQRLEAEKKIGYDR